MYSGNWDYHCSLSWEFSRRLIAIKVSLVQLLSHVWLCDPMDCSTPGFPVHHQLPELAQSHVHGVGDAIQPSHPLSFPSPPALSLSQHQSLFKRVSSGGQCTRASVSALPILDWFPLEVTGLISLWSKGLSRVFFSSAVQKHKFFSAQSYLWSNFHIHTWPWL